MSQIFTTPSQSLEMAIPSVACRLIDLILAEGSDVDSGPVVTRSVDKAPACQNLIEQSPDDEIREEENVREVRYICPVRVLIRQGTKLMISQM